MQFEFDPEILIEEVKKRPGLWDHESLEYRSKQYKQDAWKDIVRTLAGSSDIGKIEMRDLELQLQKKWKSFRDCYTKLLRNPNRQRPYIYTKQLSFLKPRCTRSKPAETKTEDYFCHSEEETTKIKKRRRHKVFVKKERKSDDVSTDSETYLEMSDETDDNENEPGNQNYHNQSISDKKREQFAFANVAVEQNTSNDCDRLFLMSMLPHLKSIPDQYKLNVKMELLQVLQNAISLNGDRNII